MEQKLKNRLLAVAGISFSPQSLNSSVNTALYFLQTTHKRTRSVLQLPSFSCSVCTKSFHLFISLELHLRVYSRKTFIFTSFFGLSALCGQNQHIFKNSHSFTAPAVQCAQSLFRFLLSLKHTSELTDTNFFSLQQCLLYNNS